MCLNLPWIKFQDIFQRVQVFVDLKGSYWHTCIALGIHEAVTVFKYEISELFLHQSAAFLSATREYACRQNITRFEEGAMI